MFINTRGRNHLREWPSIGPTPERLEFEEFYRERCIIYGKEIDGIVCGCGIAIYAVFWFLFVCLGFFGAYKFISSRLNRRQTEIPDFRARLARYLNVPYSSLPGDLRMHISDSIGSERFHTWKSLAHIYGVGVLPQNSACTLAEVAYMTLVRISDSKGNSFTLGSLLMNLQDLKREDTALRVVTHLDRCIPCTEYLSSFVERNTYVKSDTRAGLVEHAYSQHGGSLCSVNSVRSEYYPGEIEEKLMSAPSDCCETPLGAAASRFWSEFGNSRIAEDRRYCIMRIVYQEFEFGQCKLLRQFRSLRRWPIVNREFRAMLERPSPAEEFFNSFLMRKPDYTYQKLKEDLEKIEHYSLLQGIAEHYNAEMCPHCFGFSRSVDEMDRIPPKRTSHAVDINSSDADCNLADSGAPSSTLESVASKDKSGSDRHREKNQEQGDPSSMWAALASKYKGGMYRGAGKIEEQEYAGDLTRTFADVTAMPNSEI